MGEAVDRGGVAHLGDPAAIDRLTHALAELHPTWIRARAALLADLAFAHAAAGDRDARPHPRPHRAPGRSQQIHSDRTLRRLAAARPTRRPRRCRLTPGSTATPTSVPAPSSSPRAASSGTRDSGTHSTRPASSASGRLPDLLKLPP